jgi:hypothetical protein
MNVDDARRILVDCDPDDGPVTLPAQVLHHLTVLDLPEDLALQVGVEEDHVLRLDWSGTLGREGDSVFGEADLTQTRKYWYSPLNLEHYLDLVRRAVETRHRLRGDVELTDYGDDGAYIALRFRIRTTETNLAQAYDAVRRVTAEIEESADRVVNDFGTHIAEAAARISGWGSERLDRLVDDVETARSADDKGRALEELCSRLFASVPGFSVTGRVKTQTEEIDISVVNGSTDPRLSREESLILAECKNWTGKCGKDEFVLFKEKIENRIQRSSPGFLISWNGFTETITKEMLRGSRERVLVVPMTAEDIRTSVQADDFQSVLLSRWNSAIMR